MKFAIFILMFATSLGSSAAMLTYIPNNDSKLVRNEVIHTLLIRNSPKPSVTIYSETTGCKVNTSDINEALALHAALTVKTKRQVWLQCFGESKDNGSTLNIETSQYTLGTKL